MLTKVLGSFRKDIVYVELLKSITTYKSFGVFCKKFEADFGHVQIPTGYKPPVEESLGKLASKQPNTMASDVILKTSASATLKEFEYDGSCPNAAFFVAAPSISAKLEEMVHLLYGPNKTTPLQRVNKVDVDIFLPEGHNWNDFVSLAVYCVQKKVVLADVAIDKTLAESVPLHNPKAYIKKANITGKGDASTPGPVSALSLFSSSMAALVAVIAIRNCFGNPNFLICTAG
ncbi:uncharacterized protein LOC142765935 [Rhipicephalus microplus]|uniref:uncharacterized protein LOC142765935 n=1 Tax=Rhipicephalus microplus TaxID=6941 RepID=UPI003F6C0229